MRTLNIAEAKGSFSSLLDTCALLWLASGSSSLSRKARELIDGAATVFVSPISLWEIARKVKKGTLFAIPSDAAVVGADDDETFCLSADPPLTSIRIDFEGAGRKAAEVLDGLMGRGQDARAPGKPIIARFEEARLATARSMLSSSDAPVKEIAAMCGFASANYFARLFHSRTGLAPLAFRRSG